MEVFAQKKRKKNNLKGEGEGGWSELPKDLLRMILSNLIKLADNINNHKNFGGVCRSWESVALEIPRPFSAHSPSLLILQTIPGYIPLSTHSFYSFLNIFHDKVYLSKTPYHFSRIPFGVHNAWMVTGEDCLRGFVNNLLTGEAMQLPHQLSPKRYQSRPNLAFRSLTKIVLSSEPTSSNCIVMGISYYKHYRLAFCKLGDAYWTNVIDKKKHTYTDLTYFDGQFYAIARDGTIVVCDLVAYGGGYSPRAKQITSPESVGEGVHYLAELSGELLLVYSPKTKPDVFEIFKRDRITKKWAEVKSLDDHTLFLSRRTSFSLLTSNYPKLRANSIYFISQISGGKPHGIYNIKDGSHEPFDYFISDQIQLEWNAGYWIPPIREDNNSKQLESRTVDAVCTSTKLGRTVGGSLKDGHGKMAGVTTRAQARAHNKIGEIYSREK